MIDRKTMMLLLLAATLAARAEENEPEVYRVFPEVAQQAPARFAVNVGFGNFAPWNVDRRVNVWNLFNNLEPMLLQYFGQCDGGGVDFIQHTSAPRLSFWDCARSGYWDGAQVRIYRLENGVLSLLRTSRVKRSVLGNDPVTNERTEEKLYLADSGPAIRSGDFYILDDVRTEYSPFIRPALMESPHGTNFLLDGYCNFQGKLSWRFDTNTFAPEGGSTASLRLDIGEASPEVPAGPWQWYLINNSDEPHIHLRPFPGKAYRAQVWLRQEGMSDPRALVQLGCFTSQVVEVGTTWKKYEFDLPVDQPMHELPKRQHDGSRLLVGGFSKGTLWMDNLLVWQTDVEPYAILPYVKQALRDFRPGALRLWEGLTAPTLDAWLGEGFAQPNLGKYQKSDRLGGVSLRQSLSLCEEIGSDPWLILNPLLTREEHLRLVEYLAGPADQGYGRVRAREGRVEPWTTAFRKIYLECGNEMWNSIMPKNFSGQPEVYAAFADRQFRELKASPYFDRSKLETIANGWDNQMGPQGWTHRVALNSQEADRVDMACYFGGWEAGASALASEHGATAEVYQDKLWGTPIEFGRKLVQALVLKPDLNRSLCAVLREQPQLLAEGLATYESKRVNWTRDQLTPEPGLPVAQAIPALWAKDTNFTGSIRSVLAHRRKEIERVLWNLAYLVVATDPALQAQAQAALNLPDPALLRPLCEGLADLNAPSRLLNLMKTNPAVVARWLEGEYLDSRPRADLQAFAEKGAPLTYSITNELNKKLRDLVTRLAQAGDPAFLHGLLAEATAEQLRPGLQLADYMTRSMFGEPLSRRSEQLMLAMKENPVFAREVVAFLATENTLFEGVAKEAAATFSRHMAGLYSGSEPFNPDEDSALLLRMLTPSVSRELLARMNRLAGQVEGTLSQESQFFLLAMLRAAAGDTGPALALAGEARVIDLMQQKLAEALPQPFLLAAQQDTTFGNQLLAEMARRPAPGAKQLAVYEGGPGYALPGPGKPPAEDDENIGKSLVMGTATLDCFLQFMSMGVSPLGYYDFKSGSHWASHNNPIDMTPYPSWLGLQMVNQQMQGDLLQVERLSGATVDVPDKEIMRTTNDGKSKPQKVAGRKRIPMSACHVFRDGKRYAVLLINRDFQQARPFRLELPADGTAPSRQFTLTHPDPTTHNRSAFNVKIAEGEGPVLKRGMTVSVPRASSLMLVGEVD